MTEGIARKLALVLITAMLLMLMAPAYTANAPIGRAISISSFTDLSGSLNIDVGKGERVTVGAKGVIIRDGKQIGDYQVLQVNWGFSRIQVLNLADGFTVQPGDSAPITETPVVKKSSKSKSLWIAVAAAAAVAIFLGKHSSNSGSSASQGGGAVSLTADKVTNADGSSAVTITARVSTSTGEAAPDGTAVNFSSSAGRLNRSQTTTSAGRATAILNYDSTERANTATVTVKSLGGTSTITIPITKSMTLTASEPTIQVTSGGGTVTTSTITATCQDAAGNPATSGTITFDASIGTVLPDTTEIGAGGVTTATFTSDTPGRATITATWALSNVTTTVTVTAGLPYSIAVSSNTTSVQADGNSFARITATVTDVMGNLATNGTVVEFSVIPDSGGGGNGTIAAQATTTNGVAVANLYSRDAASAPSDPGTATVSARVLIASQPLTLPRPATDLENHSTTVQFVSPDVGSIEVSANPTNIRGLDKTGSSTTLRAAVYNTDHQPVPNGTAVTFSATHGLVYGSNSNLNGISTTTNGIAVATLATDASGGDGYVDVTATAGGVTITQTHLVIFSGPPSPTRCEVVLSSSTFPAVHGQTIINITALDVNSHPVANATVVTVITDKGSISADGVGTLTGGRLVFTLSTSTDPLAPTPAGTGTVSVSIDSGGTNAENGGAPVIIEKTFTVTVP